MKTVFCSVLALLALPCSAIEPLTDQALEAIHQPMDASPVPNNMALCTPRPPHTDCNSPPNPQQAFTETAYGLQPVVAVQVQQNSSAQGLSDDTRRAIVADFADHSITWRSGELSIRQPSPPLQMR